MKPDDFEQRLRQPLLRCVPSEWREEILGAAQQETGLDHASRMTRHHSLRSAFSAKLSAVLWPCPQAWAGLACVWLVILAMNYATADKTVDVAKKMPASSPEMISSLKEEERLLAELIGPPSAASVAERPKPTASRPRSERRNELLMG